MTVIAYVENAKLKDKNHDCVLEDKLKKFKAKVMNLQKMTISKIDAMAKELNFKFDATNGTLDTTSDKIDATNCKIDTMAKDLNSKFDATNGKFDTTSDNIDATNCKIDTMAKDLSKFDATNGKMDAMAKDLNFKFGATNGKMQNKNKMDGLLTSQPTMHTIM